MPSDAKPNCYSAMSGGNAAVFNQVCDKHANSRRNMAYKRSRV
jgi:hypothetical protein